MCISSNPVFTRRLYSSSVGQSSLEISAQTRRQEFSACPSRPAVPDVTGLN
jgi:hypothetical protein